VLIFSFILFKFVYKDFLKTKFFIKKDFLKQIFFFSLPLFLSGGGNLILSYTDTLMITFFRTVEEVGYYNSAMPTARLLLFFVLPISSVVFPLSSELWTKKLKNHLKEGIQLLYRYVPMFLFPIIAALIIFPDIIISFIFKTEYVIAANTLRILSIGILFQSIWFLNNGVLIGIGMPKKVMKITYIAAFVNLILNLILIPLFGFFGAAIATAFSYFLMMIISIIVLKRKLKMPLPFTKLSINSILFVFLSLVLFYFKGIFVFSSIFYLILVMLVFSIVYVILLFILKLVSIKEIIEIKKRLF
jgi:O-antigen/teichoic acid export membrane protein